MTESGPDDRGPDLTAGIARDRLADGESLEGHAGDDAVLLVRRGDAFFAIGAQCTHYGGPLAEGLVHDDTVRCPWHHACFSLRTGDAIGPPALDPVDRYDLAIEDGVVRVVGKRERQRPPEILRGGPASVVIVGSGAAGTAAAITLRREGYEGPVTIVDPEEAAPYDRPNLSKAFLSGDAPAEWLPLRPEGWFAEHRIDRIRERAARIDVDARRIELESGDSLPYDALLLATGASPVRLPVTGADLPHVHVLRTLSDCRSILADAEDAKRAVIVGAGFIGLEAAASLRARGLDVTVVAPESLPFERLLGRELATFLKGLHQENGVSFRLERTVEEIDEEGVRLDDGARLEADLVLVGIGVRPDTALAEEAGLPVNDGVLVDDRLATQVPGIYVAGDAVRFPDPRTGERIRIEHWTVALQQGQAAARNLMGRDEPYRAVPFFWTRQHGISLQYIGHAKAWDETRVEGRPENGDGLVRYVKDGRVMAVAAVGRDRESLEAEVELAEEYERGEGLESPGVRPWPRGQEPEDS
jgi:apoptosis-inducing factor 3